MSEEEDFDAVQEWVTAIGSVENLDEESIREASVRLAVEFPLPWVDFDAADMYEAYCMGLNAGWQLP